MPSQPLFYRDNIILMPKPDKGITREENYRALFFMTIDAKIAK